MLGFRYPWTWGFVLLTKVTPGIGLLWFAVRREWRALAIALGVTGVIVAVSLVLDRPAVAATGSRSSPRRPEGGSVAPVQHPDPAVAAAAGRRRARRLGRPDRPALDGRRGRDPGAARAVGQRLRDLRRAGGRVDVARAAEPPMAEAGVRGVAGTLGSGPQVSGTWHDRRQHETGIGRRQPSPRSRRGTLLRLERSRRRLGPGSRTDRRAQSRRAQPYSANGLGVKDVWALAGLLALGASVPILLAASAGAIGLPSNDDWVYRRAADQSVRQRRRRHAGAHGICHRSDRAGPAVPVAVTRSSPGGSWRSA